VEGILRAVPKDSHGVGRGAGNDPYFTVWDGGRSLNVGGLPSPGDIADDFADFLFCRFAVPAF
jgi:hypothetical protein